MFMFCMCNSSFFETMDEAGRNSNIVCGGMVMEMVFLGGEEVFVKKIFVDLLIMKDLIYWFMMMCGKKSTMTTTRSFFYTYRVFVICMMEFLYGKMLRWCIVWLFLKDVVSKVLVFLFEDFDGKKVVVSGR